MPTFEMRFSVSRYPPRYAGMPAEERVAHLNTLRERLVAACDRLHAHRGLSRSTIVFVRWSTWATANHLCDIAGPWR